jgi:hypothetical protein
MLLQSPSAIQPGANNRGPNPTIAWIDTPLASADLMARDQYDSWADARVFTSHKLDNGDTPAASYGDFRKLAASSLSDAIEASSLLSAANPLSDGGNEAIGVLQAADGSYYATGLFAERWRDSDVGAVPEHMTLSIDNKQRWVTVNDVQQRHADLRAVVGTGSWVNFTNETIDPKLAG